MIVPEASDKNARFVAPVYEAYAQLARMLLPSSGRLAIYAVDGDLSWCSDGFEQPGFRELVDDFRQRNQGLGGNQGVIRNTSGGVSALIARLGDSSGKVLGYVVIELDRTHTNAGKSMAVSMTRPLLGCLASQLALERRPDEAVQAMAEEEDPRLSFLLQIGEIELNSPQAIQRLLRRCVERLNCLSAVFCIPDQDLTELAEADTDGDTRAQLDSTRKHLLAWVQLNNRPMVVNRVDSVKAPYKILSCPVLDHEARPTGLIALFRGGDSPDFEHDDIRLIEFLSRQAMALLFERQDSLSGLMNRTAFERYLDEKIEASQDAPEGTLLYVDIDELKSINHSFGFAIGDEAILRTGQLIRRSLTPGEVGCRLAADRFALFLPERNREITERLGGELAKAAESLGYAFAGRRVPLLLRFGVAEAPEDLAGSRHWIAAAELACQEKRAGRDSNSYNGSGNGQGGV